MHISDKHTSGALRDAKVDGYNFECETPVMFICMLDSIMPNTIQKDTDQCAAAMQIWTTQQTYSFMHVSDV